MAKKVVNEDIRINKFISDSGFCSRREADQLIVNERVTINGELATLGSRVVEGDKVKIDGEPIYFIPMEMREYKLRRYGSSHRVVQEGDGAEVKRQPSGSVRREHKPEGRVPNGAHSTENRRGGARKRSASVPGKASASREKLSGGRGLGVKPKGLSGAAGRGKSQSVGKRRK